MTRPYNTRPSCLEEKLRPFGRVNTIVKVAASCISGFFHARIAATVVGNASSPDFLVCSRSENGSRVELTDRFRLYRSANISVHVRAGNKLIPTSCVDGVDVACFFNQDAMRSPIEFH